jgi:hypothetical protein
MVRKCTIAQALTVRRSAERLLVALASSGDLFVHAKDLFDGANSRRLVPACPAAQGQLPNPPKDQSQERDRHPLAYDHNRQAAVIVIHGSSLSWSLQKPSSLLIEHDGLIHFEERPLDRRLWQSVPL